ncbi:hypothetical protein LIER_40373 [Lithospermum erythrorhizon]|uniref:Uncharacterized protein n=1 Tax=Lithospermum erythrorhizon TaxID=34254 RepID=A0AAV3QV74_LITER
MLPKGFAVPFVPSECAEVCVDVLVDCSDEKLCECFEILLVGWCVPWIGSEANKIQCSSHNDCNGTISNNTTNYCIRNIGAPKGFCLLS